MTTEDPDKRLRELIARVFVPPALCPSDPDEIESMLDAAGGQPLPDEQVERMLKKAKGELPIGERKEEEPAWSEDALTEEERALVALHRNQGDDLPPELEEKLQRLREQVRVQPEEEEDRDDELEP